MLRYTLILAIGSFLISSCVQEECTATRSYVSYQPVFKTLEEINQAITFTEDRVLENPGKFFYYQDMILINEKDKGVHLIDNSDLSNPQKLGFLNIEGNIDISLSGNYLYADTYNNILVMDISDIRKPEITCVIHDVKDIWFDDRTDSYLVGYEETNIVETFTCEDIPDQSFFFTDDRLFVDAALDVDATFSGAPEAAINGRSEGGQAGSLTRMALFDEHFYYINDWSMHIFDVSQIDKPDRVGLIQVEWGIETIFPYNNNLFIGGTDGMHIFDNSNPAEPRWLSTFRHANACDPVVVQDDIAYVTLRNGSECQNFTNQLDVVDVSDLSRPELIASFEMFNPHGLSIREDVLYICEGEEGLKVFDAEEPEEVGKRQIGGVEDFFAFDVISVTKDVLLMIGEDGFYQFDTSDPEQPQLLSSIKVGE